MSPEPTPPAQRGSASPPPPEGVRETLDSIVIALILAFVFRAFIIEAFVIPTGSMAATLNGAHGTMICRNCGWEFAYGLTDLSVQRNGDIRRDGVAICPNCRYPNQTLEINDERHNYENGDRILVLKWPFDIGGELLSPHRWNVVVFKDPSDGKQNYIKRLAGLPEEVLEIVDGDVYVAPIGKVAKQTYETLDALRHVKYLRRSGAPSHEANRLDQQLAGPLTAALADLDEKLKIQRKTAFAQKDLWQVVYDHDYPPQQVGDEQPRWRPDEYADAWKVAERTLRFDGLEAKPQSIRLYAMLDSFCSYNALPSPALLRAYPLHLVPVSDLRVHFVLDYKGGDGAIRVRLSKRDDIFAGELAADGTARLLRARADAPESWRTIGETKLAALAPGEQVELAFWNLDYRVGLAIDGKEVLATNDDEYAPDITRLRMTAPARTTPPAITAERLNVELRHVVAESDIYYLSVRPPTGGPAGAQAWGTQNHPILLRAGEYFMLGDNSAQSKDSRLWSGDEVGDHLRRRGEAYQVGTVPEDQLIGRAFFVYWPSGLRTTLIPFLRDRGWIPNFGQMRWIR